MSKVKNPKLASKGKISHQWAKDHMKILNNTLSRLKHSKPLAGVTVGFCLHITKETSVLLVGAKELGANVVACGGNPLTTQDDIAAFLASKGIHVYAWSDETAKEYDWCIDKVLGHNPSILVDDGGDLNIRAHFGPRSKSLKILGATEETTAGVNRIRAVQKSGKLKYPLILVNNAYTKYLFDNRYGTGQSTVDGCLRAMNLLFASKRVVISGYGWVGKGVASRCAGMGSKVYVTEVNPLAALEAHMDGYEVLKMSKAAKIGDLFITCTGMKDVIRKEHIKTMKDGAILANVGHFDVEIDSEFLLKKSKSVKEIRPNLDECLLSNKKRVYLIGKGRIANLVAAEGHPPEVMAQSFSNQLLSILHILKNHDSMTSDVHAVPSNIDNQIAKDALDAMDVKIDTLSKDQIKYGSSW